MKRIRMTKKTQRMKTINQMMRTLRTTIDDDDDEPYDTLELLEFTRIT